jgi:hypothetical protein
MRDNKRSHLCVSHLAVIQQGSSEVVNHSNLDMEGQTTGAAVQHPVEPHDAQLENGSGTNNVQPVSTAQRFLSWVLEPRAGSTPNPTIRSTSKRDTLIGSLLGLASVERAFVRVLGVGLSWDHVQGRALLGPPHDMLWLQNFFAGQEDIEFNYLLDQKATLEAIRHSVKKMYLAKDTDYLVLYFAGHGTANNGFELYDPASDPLTEVILNDWIVELRKETSKHIPVYIVFDFCRESHVVPQTSLAEGVNVIWACSPTESALDLRLNKDNDLPLSCFLIAMLLTIGDASKDSNLVIWKLFAVRLKELVNVVRGVQCFRSRCRPPWYCCRCETCMGGGLCNHGCHSDARRPFQVVSISNPEVRTILVITVLQLTGYAGAYKLFCCCALCGQPFSAAHSESYATSIQ